MVDGKPLVLAPDRTAELPRLDLRQAHIVRAEVEFSDGSMARKDIVLGGEYMERGQTDLTAVAVVLQEHATMLRLSDLQGAILARAKPVSVTAIE